MDPSHDRIAPQSAFSPGSAWRFNFLDYELHRPGPGGGIVENLVNLFSEVLQVAERQAKFGGREDEGYWRRAMRQLVRNLLDLLILAQNYISIS
ncbi:MAG: hypothetical protein JNM18_13575, partial [Planctomycetaceae bacterium]|nr:hypothetical protein [Planctomycetaceae bacterium]